MCKEKTHPLLFAAIQARAIAVRLRHDFLPQLKGDPLCDAGSRCPLMRATPRTMPCRPFRSEAHVYREPLPRFPLRSVRLQAGRAWQARRSAAGPGLVFGGGWTTGTPVNAVAWARWAAGSRQWWAWPRITGSRHRFGTHALWSAVADARAALRWVEDHAAELGIDPTKIVVGGNSAGGHLALWTAISHAPPGSDPGESPRIKPAAIILTSGVSDTSEGTGYTSRRFGKNALALSPVHQFDAKMPPVLVFHGDAGPGPCPTESRSRCTRNSSPWEMSAN